MNLHHLRAVEAKDRILHPNTKYNANSSFNRKQIIDNFPKVLSK